MISATLNQPHSTIVPDLLAPGLKLVFCGMAPSRISAAQKAYYANPANAFWPTLHRVGITPRRFSPQEYPKLLALGIGLTDMCKTEIGNDDELSRASLDADAFWEKMRIYQPRRIAFTSKNAAKCAFTLKRTLEYGLHEACPSSATIQYFVLPSTSGRARRFWQEAPWQQLGQWLDEV